ncbi:MAG: amidohydrolase [Candidatus Bathyarchaeota archaeon]|nr:amidohydrolase [Candidatus Bathyarchaeota archaeon]
MRIDCHVHGDPNGIEYAPKKYVEACRKRGIEAIVLIEPFDRCLEASKKFGDFIIPVARINMDDAGAEEVEQCINAGCKGIKFIRPSAPYGDECYWPMYQKIEELNAAAVFHTGYLAFREREFRPVWMEHMRAAQIEVVARRFPDLKILMSHFSNPWWEEAWKVSWTRKNVYADLSGGTAIHRSMRMWTEMFAPDGKLLESSLKKLCFASDVKYFNGEDFRFEPYITFYERLFDRLKLSEELRELVNRGNARVLFGLE